ncbi:MAG: coenzyme F420-0:L-glutamate ligase [Thermoprotei archaeon]|nr:MAG: coenzyme F420-0:L-glutamate ligase [Thermoprotei archaeon]
MPIEVKIIGLENFPLVREGDDLGLLIVETAKKNNVEIADGDIIVVSSKIVSKAEGRVVKLSEIVPSEKALKIAEITGKDPRLVEVILRESIKVVKAVRGHLIVTTKHGLVCANAGVDKSNVAGTSEIVALLPENPDESARKIRKRIRELTGKNVAVIITDTYGRPLREGHINMAIGAAGIEVFKDYRGTEDLFGYILRVKRIAIADEIASAAELVMGNGAEGIPVAVIKGLKYKASDKASARELNMPENKWLFK